MDALPDYPTRPELGLVATLQLVTRFASTRNPQLALAAQQQLRVLAADHRQPAAVRQCARQLLGDWQALAMTPADHANAC